MTKCCEDHAYSFINRCKDSKHYEQEVCKAPEEREAKLPIVPTPCPAHCTTDFKKHFNASNVKIQTGQFVMTNPSEAFKNAKIHSYCAKYWCNEQLTWSTGFDVCICPDPEQLKKIDNEIQYKNLPRCCPSSFLTLEKGKVLTCPLSKTENPHFDTCASKSL